MDFKQAYKQSAEILDPSPEAMERMKSNILARAAQPEKKVSPYKKLSYIGGAVAACAVIAFAGIKLLPSGGIGVSDETAAYNGGGSAAMQEVECSAKSSNDCFEMQADEAVAGGAAFTTTAAVMDEVNEYFSDGADDSEAEVSVNSPSNYEGGSIGTDAEAACEDVEFSENSAVVTFEIVFSDDMANCFIGSMEYVLIPDSLAAELDFPENHAEFMFTAADGTEYTVYDDVSFIEVFREDELIGYYCAPDIFEHLLTSADAV